MICRCLIVCLLLLAPSAAQLRAAVIWREQKINSLPYVTFDSFCEFYEFNKTAVPDGSFTISGIYGKLALKANSREAWFDGRRVWLSFPFVRDEHGNGFVSRLDVIKLFDPLLRRNESAPRQKVPGVVIDAGHGGTDSGTRSRANYFEKTATLDTAKRLQTILKAEGIPTYMTRTEDVFIGLPERSSLANLRKNWIFISLHYNEAAPTTHGVETYCLSPRHSPSTSDAGKNKTSDKEAQPGNKNDTLNVILADYIHAEITKLQTNQGDRGVKRARFVVLKNTEIPAVLVEGGFLSNSADARLITSGAYRQKLAESVARGVKNYLALMNSAPSRPPTVIKPAPAKPPFRPPTVTPPKPEEVAPEPSPSAPQFSGTAVPPNRIPVIPNLNEITREVPAPPDEPKLLPEEEPAPEPESPPASADNDTAEPEHPESAATPEPAPADDEQPPNVID